MGTAFSRHFPSTIPLTMQSEESQNPTRRAVTRWRAAGVQFRSISSILSVFRTKARQNDYLQIMATVPLLPPQDISSIAARVKGEFDKKAQVSKGRLHLAPGKSCLRTRDSARGATK